MLFFTHVVGLLAGLVFGVFGFLVSFASTTRLSLIVIVLLVNKI